MIQSNARPTPANAPAAAPTPALDRLLRWQQAGGTWEVVQRSVHEVTIALCRCDGGEEADRFTSTDATLLAHLATRSNDGERD